MNTWGCAHPSCQLESRRPVRYIYGSGIQYDPKGRRTVQAPEGSMNTHCFSSCLPLTATRSRSDVHGLGEANPFSLAASGAILASVIIGVVAAILYLVSF
jgi:hypothetical protein